MTAVGPDPAPAGYDRIVVGGLIADSRGRILLLKRSPDEFMPGAWEIPSGGVEAGEELEAALRREIREETGLELVEVASLAGSAEYAAGDMRCLQLNFAVRCEGAVTLSQEHCDMMWWEPDGADPRIDGFMRKVLSPVLPVAP
jgi:8-oxo-dGTP diphosphatase